MPSCCGTVIISAAEYSSTCIWKVDCASSCSPNNSALLRMRPCSSHTHMIFMGGARGCMIWYSSYARSATAATEAVREKGSRRFTPAMTHSTTNVSSLRLAC